MRNNFQIWVDAVCDCVRFRPDRRGIEKELRVHYEDHVKDLIRLGRDRELAEERALEAMGNAQEVGRSLDRVHKPWLGWLWEGTRLLLLALAVSLVWTWYQGGYGTRSLFQTTRDQLAWAAPASGASHVTTGYADLWLAPGEAAEVDGHIEAALTFWIETRDVYHSEYLCPLSYFEVAVDGAAIPPYQDRDKERDTGWWAGGSIALNGWTRQQFQITLVLDRPPKQVTVGYRWANWALEAEWEDAA